MRGLSLAGCASIVGAGIGDVLIHGIAIHDIAIHDIVTPNVDAAKKFGAVVHPVEANADVGYPLLPPPHVGPVLPPPVTR